MKTGCAAGITLIELLVAIVIASLVGSMIMHMVIRFQSCILAEISRNDLQDRADRLIRFLANDIREAAFQIGSIPLGADGLPISLVHDSLAGDPSESMTFSILPCDHSDDDDSLTFVKAESFAPPLYLIQPAIAGDDWLVLNRRPNHSPGSTRELLPTPEAINQLVLANHRISYDVQHAEQSLQLGHPLAENAPADTEVLGVRACSYQLEPFSGSKRLRRDDFTTRDILDDAVDGLQFEYLLSNGSLVSLPSNPSEVRGVKISLLVRDQRSDRQYINRTVFSMGNTTYGPYLDHFRRIQVSKLVEVKNHGL